MNRPLALTLCAAMIVGLAALVVPVRKALLDFSHRELSASAAAHGDSVYRTIDWEALIPKDWDPMKQIGQDPSSLSDSNPRAMKLLRDMRQTWDNAPTVEAMNGAAVRLPGYVVPVDQTKEGLRQFLLVPYFGACIHSPPPPANQIIDVIVDHPADDIQSMDAVWVSGVLQTARTDSTMGMSGYKLKAARVEPYEPPKQP
ncbi:MAG TPA: DUF3299 domain-containing protein [Ramlibacter sp.]|uniref:DUF3299 domain-containing protein n=1 Tax=Ramlibacter sp. TaxID=1917967 RepID=UPI002CA04716|nr:DUF3299 domain-containing protein [Ramlibacter sp.]HVZ44505.1 DUF3299 domain-containing protein [Ramlibacter sp.]